MKIEMNNERRKWKWKMKNELMKWIWNGIKRKKNEDEMNKNK